MPLNYNNATWCLPYAFDTLSGRNSCCNCQEDEFAGLGKQATQMDAFEYTDKLMAGSGNASPAAGNLMPKATSFAKSHVPDVLVRFCVS